MFRKRVGIGDVEPEVLECLLDGQNEIFSGLAEHLPPVLAGPFGRSDLIDKSGPLAISCQAARVFVSVERGQLLA